MRRTARAGTLLFFLGFAAVGMIGTQVQAAAFEAVLTGYLGASAFLFLLCLGVLMISTFALICSSQHNGRYPGWFAGLVGGAIAGGTFCGSVGAGYIGLLQHSLFLSVLLPPGISLLWPFLSAKPQADRLN
ncbi:MAG TPA: hypothetical protein VFZ16_02575 [Hyphomicrobiaceae bacterium]|nr:hypothetical protein [Hyphomicrobiaceae bacterium]